MNKMKFETPNLTDKKHRQNRRPFPERYNRDRRRKRQT